MIRTKRQHIGRSHSVSHDVNTVTIDSVDNEADGQNIHVELQEFVPFYKKYKYCFKLAHININSVRHRHGPLYA